MSDIKNMSNIANDLMGQKLKEYRLSHLWTLQQVASMSGLSVSTIQKIESGTVIPHDLSIAKLCKAFPDLNIVSNAA